MVYKSNIFFIDPDIEKRIHPEALKILTSWENLELLMLPTNLTATDAYSYLNENGKSELKRCIDKIFEGLNTCMDVADGVPLYDVYVGDIFFKRGIISEFQRTSWLPLFSLKQLLREACDRKLGKDRREAEEVRKEKSQEEKQKRQEAAKAEEEQRRREEVAEAERREKEEKERWHAARKAVNPPTDEARNYLNRPGEFEEFIQATLKAIEVYIEKGKDYLNDGRTFDYRLCLEKINLRKEKERQQIAAEHKAREYNECLNKEIIRLKKLLHSNKKDLDTYFEKQNKDPRYRGEDFAQFLSGEEERAFDNTIVDIATKRLDKLVSNDLRQFIDGKYYRYFFPLLSAEYSFEGGPCIDFIFDVFAVLETRVWLKPDQKTFGDYVFDLPWREGKGYSVLLKEPEFLGYNYVVLAPEDLGGYVHWKSVPLNLVIGLMNDELQPAGTIITAASENGRSYRIKNFEEEVTIPRSFEDYLKKIGNFDEMISFGIMDQRVADIIEGRLEQLGSQHQVSASDNKRKRKNSKKAEAFRLFDEGKRPSDPELKALGLKDETIYRYYQEWKKLCAITENSA